MFIFECLCTRNSLSVCKFELWNCWSYCLKSFRNQIRYFCKIENSHTYKCWASWNCNFQYWDYLKSKQSGSLLCGSKWQMGSRCWLLSWWENSPKKSYWIYDWIKWRYLWSSRWTASFSISLIQLYYYAC